MDSFSNMDEYNLRVFLMVTHSACGALPLAIFVTSDEKEQTLKDALEMLKTCLPDYAFYGAQFPKVVMTDNCYELRSSLSDVWPGAVSLLCLFHVLQQEMLKAKKTCRMVLMILYVTPHPHILVLSSMSPMFLKNVRHGQCAIVLNYL